MPTKLQDRTDRLAAKRQELHDIFAAAGPDIDLSAEQVEDVQHRNAELDELAKEVADLRRLDDIQQKNRVAIDEAERIVRPVPHAAGQSDQPSAPSGSGGAPLALPAQSKSLGQLFVESKAYSEFNPSNGRGPIIDIGVDYKTLMATSTAFTPQAIRTGQVIDSAQQMPRIVDVVPSTTTTQVSVVYMRETTFTNAAAETDEGADKPEAALAWTEITSPVRKIAVWIPVTDEQMADIQGMQDRINNRLTLMLRQRLDQQIIAGNGSAPNLDGFLHLAGVQTQARGTDPNVDAVYKGLTKLRAVGFVEPTAVLMHPNDWQDVRLLRTADGVYIYGYPGDPGVDRLWGLPVVQSTYVTENTALAGDFQGYSELAYKQGIEFEVSNSHGDYFVKDILAIRGQLRVALVIYRPAAFCKITGM